MAAQITQAEINELKKQFEKKIGKYTVIFDVDENGEETFKAWNSPVRDAVWSGQVLLEKDYFVKWSFSLINGFKVLESVFQINDENVNIINMINNIYNIWYENLNKYVIADEGGSSDLGGEEQVSVETGELGDVEEEIEGGTEEEEAPLSESKTKLGREKIIKESSERMKKLAGLG
jgi:hypothetical protein